MRQSRSKPDFSLESTLIERGRTCIAGVDEAGRGPLAGPVVAAAVILDPDNIPCGLDDSKRLSKAQRLDRLSAILATSQIAWALRGPGRIDSVNIRQATLEAMAAAVAGLALRPDALLIDGRDVPEAQGSEIPGPNRAESHAVVGGDSRSLSVAAASIVAKCMRDALMQRAALRYPVYGFEKHSGYGTRAHVAALAEHGPCPLHRRSFAPVRSALGNVS